jgi:hypothetical protein
VPQIGEDRHQLCRKLAAGFTVIELWVHADLLSDIDRALLGVSAAG